MLAGPHDDRPPVLAAGEHAIRQRGQQTRAHHGGLAASRRADNAEQRRPDEPGDQFGRQAFAAEEVLRVVDVEGREAFERADDRPAQSSDAPHGLRRTELGDLVGELGLHRAQLARPAAVLCAAIRRGARSPGAPSGSRRCARVGDAAAGLEEPPARGIASKPRGT